MFIDVRLLIIKIVIQGLLMHTLLIYACPISLLKYIEKWNRNFIWSDDTSTRKFVTFAWNKCCQRMEIGGLGLRSLMSINEASNLLQYWQMEDSEDH